MQLQNVVFACRDLPEMVRFYRDGLGLEVFFHSETTCFLKLGGSYLALYAAKPGEAVTTGVMLDIAVESVQGKVAEIRQRGIPVDETDGLPVATDPAGNRIEFVRSPAED